MSKKPPPLGPKTHRLTRTAEADFDSIVDYIADAAGNATAQRFAAALDAELTTLALLGHGGVSREAVSPGLRMTVFGNYCIYFRVAENETTIVHPPWRSRYPTHLFRGRIAAHPKQQLVGILLAC